MTSQSRFWRLWSCRPEMPGVFLRLRRWQCPLAECSMSARRPSLRRHSGAGPPLWTLGSLWAPSDGLILGIGHLSGARSRLSRALPSPPQASRAPPRACALPQSTSQQEL